MTVNQSRLITIAEVCFVVGASFTLTLAMISPYPVDVSGLPAGVVFLGLLIGLLWTTQRGTRPGLRLLVGALSALLGWGYMT